MVGTFMIDCRIVPVPLMDERGEPTGRAWPPNLSCTDLTSAVLFRARMRCVNLTDANLREADLRDADLTDARLVGAVMDLAKIDGAILPDLSEIAAA